jgi:hypothetical protein
MAKQGYRKWYSAMMNLVKLRVLRMCFAVIGVLFCIPYTILVYIKEWCEEITPEIKRLLIDAWTWDD